jgi:glycine/D-amino acid oxidase-like deaminating enzyme
MGGAAFFPGATFLDDPGRMMGLIATAALTKARLVRARADRLTRGPDGVVIEGPGLHLHARRVVIAAGAHSRDLARQAGTGCRWTPNAATTSNGTWPNRFCPPHLPHRARLLLLPDGGRCASPER